jgi:hypothetical protein
VDSDSQTIPYVSESAGSRCEGRGSRVEAGTGAELLTPKSVGGQSIGVLFYFINKIQEFYNEAGLVVRERSFPIFFFISCFHSFPFLLFF